MRKTFAIRQFELGWAFTMCGSVIGIGKHNQRYFKSKEALIAELTRLGIEPREYED